jgi:hypothetical protein
VKRNVSNPFFFYSLWSKIFLLIPISFWGLWIYISETNKSATQLVKQAKFNSLLPAFLKNYYTLSLLILISCIISIILAVKGMKESTSNRVLNITTILFASLIVLLELFSLM